MLGWISKLFFSPGGSQREAAKAFSALDFSVSEADACKNRGNAHFYSGEFDKALDCYRQAIRIAPDNAAAHNNLGLVFAQQGKLNDAVTCFQKALSLKPDLAQGHINLGNVYKRLDRLDEALTCFSTALSLNPELPDAHNNLGVLLHEQGQLDDAQVCFERAISLKPDFAEAHNNLGTIFREQDKLDDALACFQTAAALKPGFAMAHNNIGTVAQDKGQLNEAYIHYREALALKPDYAEAMSNYLMAAQYDPGYSPSALYAEHLRFGERFEEPLRETWPRHNNSRAPNRRLKVGFVSGDLRTHPVGYFMESVLAHLDKRALDITLYPTTPKADDLSQRLQDIATSWHPLVGLSDTDAAQLISNEGIDILVDLSGHTADNRLLVFARKPAPIQVSWLYFSTTGLRSMDYLLCDRHVVPPEEKCHLLEHPWYLPDSYLCFTPPRENIPIGELPASRNGYITFGCFNNLTKINDTVVHCWARVLQKVPDSRLFLKSKQLNTLSIQVTTMEQFGKHGINSDRLILEGPSPRNQYLASYNRIDIALDPFPFPGGTTSVEALWMGVPVLTHRGSRFISHAGESILHTVSLSEWIASDDDDYVAKAVSFAADLKILTQLRSDLRTRFLASPLCDARRFAQNLETAFRGMWAAFVQGDAPAHVSGKPRAH